MSTLAWLAATRVGRWLTAAGAALVLIFGLLFRARRQGHSDAIRDFEEDQRREADAIRHRVDGTLRRVPKYDDLRGRRD